MAEPVSLLPEENATPWQRALSLTSAERRPIDMSALATLWDPWRCTATRLPSLAADLSVDIWDEAWPEATKRAVIAKSPRLHRLKGTLAGISEHVALIGAEVVQYVAPPQGLFLAADAGKDALDAYHRQLPEIRVYLRDRTGPARGFHCDTDFLDETAAEADVAELGFLAPDRGPAFYGRFATLFRNGVETDLLVVTQTITAEDRASRDVERISIPGDAGQALVLDADFLDEAHVETGIRAALLLTLTLDRSYRHETSSLSIDTLQPGLNPISPRYERRSLTMPADAGIYLDADWLDEPTDTGDEPPAGFLLFDRGALLVYDSLRLYDPAIEAPRAGPGGFLDHDRIGLADFLLEALVDAPRTAQPDETYLDSDWVGAGYLIGDDTARFDAALSAVTIAKAHRDKVLVSFQLTEPATLAAGLDLSRGFRFGERVARSL